MEASIAESEQIVARIVNLLAKQGVRRSSFDVTSLGLDTSNYDVDLFIDAIRWLENEGVIYSNEEHKLVDGTEPDELFACGYALTSKGFQLLASKFTGNLTLGQAVAEVSSGGRSYSSIGDLIGGVLGGFTKSVGSG